MSTVTFYEHTHKQGQSKTIQLNKLTINQVYNLDSIGMNDRISSMTWNIEEGYRLIIYESKEGQGRRLGFGGVNSNDDLKATRDFNDKASSYRYIIDNSVPDYFDVIHAGPKIVKFKSTGSIHGTDYQAKQHYQGIQALDDKHIAICSSNNLKLRRQ